MNLRHSYSWCLNCKTHCICQQLEKEREREREREREGGGGGEGGGREVEPRTEVGERKREATCM